MPGAEIRTTRKTEEAFSALVHTLNEITIYCMLIGAISKPCRITGPGREPPSMPESAETKPQVGGLRISRNAGHGRPVRVQPRNPAWF